MNQCSRRENLELQNILESVELKDLENFVLDLFKSIKLEVSSYDLVAVHRLGKPSLRKSKNASKAYISVYKTQKNE